MNIRINHNLQLFDAVVCAKNILDNLREEHSDKISNVVQRWTGNVSKFSFRLKNFNVTGTINVSDSYVEISGRLPFAAMMFKGLIENTVKNNAQKMLNKCAGQTKF